MTVKETLERLNPFQRESGVLHNRPKWKQYAYWFAVLLTGQVMGIYFAHPHLSLFGASAASPAHAAFLANAFGFVALILYFVAAGHKLRELVIRDE